MIIKKFFSVCFYKELSGREPVRVWLRALDKASRRIVGQDLKTIQFEWPWEMPLVKPFGKNLWELRSTIKNNQVRIFFMIHHNSIILLHSFIKKSQKTPKTDLELVRKRAQKIEKE